MHVLLLAALVVLLAPAAQAQTIGPDDVFSWSDDPFTIEVRATDVTNLFGFGAKLHYDEALFDYDEGSLESGLFLGTSSMITFDRQVDDGIIDFAVSRTDENTVSGGGVVATLSFTPAPGFDPGPDPPTFFLTDLVAIDNNGTDLGIAAADAATFLLGGVWPGDLNNNCDVDTDDLLPIGLSFGNTGPARSVVFDFGWKAQVFTPWVDDGDPSTDDAYADATGDGLVSETDMLPIGVNFNNTRDAATGCTPNTGKTGSQGVGKGRMTQIKAVPVPKRAQPGEAIEIELQVGPGGGAVSDLFGVSLRLGYDEEILTLGEAALGSFFTDDGTLVLQLGDLLTSTPGEAPYAAVRTQPNAGVSGSGTVATLTATIADDADKGKYDLTLSNVVAINSAGGLIELAVKTDKVQVQKAKTRNVPATSGGGGGGGANTPVTFDEEEVEVTFTELNDDITVTAARYDETEVEQELPPEVVPATDTVWELTVEGTDDFTADVCLPLEGIEVAEAELVLLDILKRTDETSDWEDQDVELRPVGEAPTQICAIRVTGFSQFVITAPAGTSVSVEDVGASSVPSGYGLVGTYPNPFNPEATVVYEMTSSGAVHLAVYDVLGREVAVLAHGTAAAGRHEVRFDAAGLPSGLYLARMTAGRQTFTRSMLLTK